MRALAVLQEYCRTTEVPQRDVQSLPRPGLQQPGAGGRAQPPLVSDGTGQEAAVARVHGNLVCVEATFLLTLYNCW